MSRSTATYLGRTPQSACSQLILDVAVFGRRGTDPAAAFLHRLTEKHDLSETTILVNGYGYLTSLSQLG
jgi:putative transposase